MMTISTLMTILIIMTIPTRRRKIKCGEEVGLLPMTIDETSASAKIASKLDQEAAGREDNDDMQRRVLLTLVNGCQQSGARKNTYMRVCRVVCPSGPFWIISYKNELFAPNGQSKVWRRCLGAKNNFLFEMVQKGPDRPKRVPNSQKHFGWLFWSLLDPLGPL